MADERPRWAEPAAAAGLILLDRLSKLWALRWLEPRGSVAVLPFFHLTYVENTGAAFGLGRGSNSLFVGLSVFLMAALLAWRRRLGPEDRWSRLGILLIVSGALGNLYDRLAYGFVIDYFDFLVWPVFNVADSLITVGAGAVGFASFFRRR